MPTGSDIMRIETVAYCRDLDAMMAFAVDELDLRVRSISPADDPQVIVLAGGGTWLRLERSDHDVAGEFVVRVGTGVSERTLVAPNGSRFSLVTDTGTYHLPVALPKLSIVRAGNGFGVGRAGMEYRDLLPDRWGGRFIASHIRIPGGGPVPDSVHFHWVRFQMIFCAAGWVEVVYEDQGESFRLEAGDCVLQPPEIRHRVLYASEGVEVIEIGCPAVHDTFIDHDTDLPTSEVNRTREFDGQRFVRAVAADATWHPWVVDGLEVRRTGIATATGGLADVAVIRSAWATGVEASPQLSHDGEFVFDVVLRGSATLTVERQPSPTELAGIAGPTGDPDRGTFGVGRLDAIAYPAGTTWRWSDRTDDFEVLEVALPADTVRPE